MISVIVPAYNEEKNIAGCLRALLSQTLPKSEFEIIVSDSSSTDNTAKIAKRYADRVVRCKKVSAGFGRNAGARKAKGGTLAFIDADTIAAPGWLEAIKESLGRKGCVAVSGPFRAMPEDGLAEKLYFAGWCLEARISTALRFPLFPGFNISARKDAFKKAGGFNAGDMVCEDYDLALRLRKYGRVCFNGSAAVRTSGRKIREIGIVEYAKHGLFYLLFKKKYTWADHRKDWNKAG